MKYFTPDDVQLNFCGNRKPRTSTLDVIRQVAYTYRQNVTTALNSN